MANNRKTAPTAKISSTSSKVGTRSQAASKENPTAKVTATRLKSGGKAAKDSRPLQESTSQARISSHGTKDVALLERIALQQAEIDKLKKRLAASARPTKNTKEIPRPDKITKLQHDMRLADDRRLYSHCRATVRDVLARAGLPLLDWRHQDLAAVAKVAEVARSKNNQLQLYKGNWATLEIMKTLIKNKRSYKKRIGSGDDEDIVMGDGEGDNEEGRDGDEEERERDGNDQRDGEEDGNDEGVGFNEEKGSGDEEFDGSGDEEGNIDDDEGGNEFEGNGGDGNGEDRAIHDDIYDDYDSAAERLAVEKEGNSGDAEGNSGKQGNDDEEGDGGDQVATKKPTVTKKPAAATKSKLAATATSKSAKPAVNNKATKPAGQARTKRKAGQDGDGNQAAGATTGNAARKAKKM